MNELITLYFNLLEWIVLNPIPALVVLLIEFCVMYWLYYKTNENKILRVVFGSLFTPQNFVFNLVGMTLIGIGDLPREGASTIRAKRWKDEYGTRDGKVIIWPAPGWVIDWRYQFATTVCSIMNRFDPDHC